MNLQTFAVAGDADLSKFNQSLLHLKRTKCMRKNLYTSLFAGIIMSIAATSASAKVYIKNDTKGCIRIYDKWTSEFKPGQHGWTDFFNPGPRFLVSVFPGKTCGGKARRSEWRNKNDREWQFKN
jgi:hypothetical protein